MNGWSNVFLGVIAVATLAIAVVHVGVLVAAGLVVRRMIRFMDQIEQDIKPILAHVDSIGRDAARVAGLAAAQVERFDYAVGIFGQRVEQLAGFFRIPSSDRNGRKGWLNAFRAGLQVIRELRTYARGRRTRSDKDDSLFV